MDFRNSERSQDLLGRLSRFIAEKITPMEEPHRREILAARNGGEWTRWRVSPAVEKLKEQARGEGLWNLFLKENEAGPGLSSVEYAPLAEEMGKSLLAPEVFNCNAPDSGNMEVLAKYGTPLQKEQWLAPLLAGRIRSAF